MVKPVEHVAAPKDPKSVKLENENATASDGHIQLAAGNGKGPPPFDDMTESPGNSAAAHALAATKGNKDKEGDQPENSGGGSVGQGIDPTVAAYSSGHPVFNDDLDGPPFGPPGPNGGATLGGLGQGNGPQGVANAARENILEIINNLPPPAQANLQDLLDQGSPVPGEDPPDDPPDDPPVENRIGLFDGPADAGGNEFWAYDGTSAFRVVGPDGTSVIENPTNFVEFNGDIYFSGDTDANGRELYKIDGTSGVISLFDINVGIGNSSPSNFFEFDGDLYFRAFDPVNGTELRKIDATTGDVSVIDINPGSSSSNPSDFATFDGALYFKATNAINGSELFKLAAGDTVPTVIDIRDMPALSSGSNPADLVEFNGGLYFGAFTDAGTKELHRLEADGALNAIPVNSDGSASNASKMFVLNGDLYFVGFRPAIDAEPAKGNELFRLNGEDGTIDVIDINPGAASSGPKDFIEFNGDVYFLADTPNGDDLLKLDGSTGVVSVVDVGPSLVDPDPDDLTVAGNSLYFEADHPTAAGDGLYQLDADGTVPVFIGDVLETETGYENFSIAGTFGDKVILEARDPATNLDGLFTYDGTNVALIQAELFANNFASFEGEFAVV